MAPRAPETTDPLVDRFGRVHTSLRLSVTDRCNIRCYYCMPASEVTFAPRETLLTFEELHRLAALLVRRCGVRDIRVTGGEPLVRRELERLIAMLASIRGLEDLSLTTNGILLPAQAARLREAGLDRLNISLDTLDEAEFRRITRRSGVHRVIEGIDAAIEAGFRSIKLNALAVTGIDEASLVRLVDFARGREVMIRFIEFMPLDAQRAWQKSDVLTGERLLGMLGRHYGELREVPRPDASQPAEEFELPGGYRLGIIRSVTAPFCGSCNRLRITADGSVRNCLFASDDVPLRDRMRAGASDDALVDAVRECVSQKRAAHGIDGDGFRPPERPMYAIGG